MTVKHWNTGAAAARFRIQAASVKLKNLAGADSPKKTQSALANSGRKHQVTSYKLPGPKPISNANKGLIHRRQASSIKRGGPAHNQAPNLVKKKI